MSLATLISRLMRQPVTPVTQEETAKVTAAAPKGRGCNPCNPGNPKKHRAEKKPDIVDPDALLLEVAHTIQANPVCLRDELAPLDMELIATGQFDRDKLLHYFALLRRYGKNLETAPRDPPSHR